eukprot:5056715-Pyramimonas_sp.AAC.1
MLRYMVRVRKDDPEGLESYMKKTHRRIRGALEKHGSIPWDHHVLLLNYSWAGHIMRMEHYDKQRIVFKACQYMNYEYLPHLKELIGSQGHQ